MDNDRHGRESSETAPEGKEPDKEKETGEPPLKLKEMELLDANTGMATLGRFKFSCTTPCSVATEDDDPCGCAMMPMVTWIGPRGSGRLALTAREKAIVEVMEL